MGYIIIPGSGEKVEIIWNTKLVILKPDNLSSIFSNLNVEKKYENFYRNGYHGLIGKVENGEYYGYIGFGEKHPWYNTRFQKVRLISIYSYQNVPQFFNITATALNKCWWMGFSTDPFSKEKTLDKLKSAIDHIDDVVRENSE